MPAVRSGRIVLQYGSSIKSVVEPLHTTDRPSVDSYDGVNDFTSFAVDRGVGNVIFCSIY